jgi:hypothetical protein
MTERKENTRNRITNNNRHPHITHIVKFIIAADWVGMNSSFHFLEERILSYTQKISHRIKILTTLIRIWSLMSMFIRASPWRNQKNLKISYFWKWRASRCVRLWVLLCFSKWERTDDFHRASIVAHINEFTRVFVVEVFYCFSSFALVAKLKCEIGYNCYRLSLNI